MHPESSIRARFHSAGRIALLVLLIAGVLPGGPAAVQSEEEQAAALQRRVLEAFQVHAGQTVADIGCGDGFYTVPLARAVGAAGKVVAVDIDERALSKLKEH